MQPGTLRCFSPRFRRRRRRRRRHQCATEHECSGRQSRVCETNRAQCLKFGREEEDDAAAHVGDRLAA